MTQGTVESGVVEIERQTGTPAVWWQEEGSGQALIARDSFGRAMAHGFRSNDTKCHFPSLQCDCSLPPYSQHLSLSIEL